MSLVTTRSANYSLLQTELPGESHTTVGVLLEDPDQDELYHKLRRDWKEISSGEDAEVLELLADDLAAKTREMGAAQLFRYLEDNLSNALRITDREPVLVDNFDRALERLYRTHVQAKVLRFKTHLPRYSLEVAAGPFRENRQIEEEGWIEAPENLTLTEDLFVAEIFGQSMEPVIPDGSLCVFRRGVVGSRQNRLVLVEDRGSRGNDRYTVKRYKSQKSATEEGWRHEKIRLESLNPDYPSWDLDPDEEKYSILAEFVRVLE